MAKKKKVNGLLGRWAFSIALLVAVIAGIIAPIGDATIAWVLVLLGLVIGLANITMKEVSTFLIAAISLVLMTTSLSIIPALGMYLQAILINIAVFVAPAAVVVALKAVYAVASTR